MGDEFSFNGHRCTEFGLHYIPGSRERWLSTPEWSTMEESVTGRPGGYWYGTELGVREFDLSCYFEDTSLERLEAIHRWLHRLAYGKLVFEDRPEVYYMVRPSEKNEGEIWWHDGGKTVRTLGGGRVTLHFKAYEVFGCMEHICQDGVDVNGEENRCGILKTDMMPPAIAKDAGTYLVYNPGTENAYPLFKLYGSAPNGLTITNKTNGDVCTLEPFNLTDGTWLEVDSDTGRVSQEPLGTLSFEYHLDGYIKLAPCIPYERGAILTTKSGSNEAQVANVYLDSSYEGHYVYLNNAWVRIIYVREDGRNIVLSESMTKNETVETMITKMNEIELAGDGLALTNIELTYTPLVR